MTDLNGLKSACDELHKRTGLYIEVRDVNNQIICRTTKPQKMDVSSGLSSITPKANKSFTIHALSKSGEAPDDTAMQLVCAYIEPYLSARDPSDIFRSFIYGNITSDIFNQLLSTYHIKHELTYRLYLIRCTARQSKEVFYITEQMADTSDGDIIFTLNNENIILIKECSGEVSPEEANELADALLQSISFETAGSALTISASNIFDSLKELNNAYLSASNTMRIGSICTAGKKVYIAEKLRLELFLDMLPQNVLREFLAMHSGQTISEAWDDKMIETVQSLFDNNLNLSVTARELYTHRNTLVYRLDKIKKISGLDLKAFDDAVIFKILMTADKLIGNQ